jgi:hypothetical protein
VNRLYNGGAKFGRGGHARHHRSLGTVSFGRDLVWREIDGNDQTWV